jgi:chitodextrinase
MYGIVRGSDGVFDRGAIEYVSGGADTTPPSDVTGLSATAVSSTQINLSWTASTDNIGIAGYDIQRCSGSGCTPTGTLYQTTGIGTTYQSTGLNAATLYRYHVRARDAAGNVSNYSSVAGATTQAIVLLPPTNLRILR